MSASFRACVVVLVVAPFAHAQAAESRGSSPMAVPSEDRAILDDLAPPTNLATARGTYGDAVFAHVPRKVRGRQVTGGPQPRPCFANRAGTPVMRCSESGSIFFRRNYVFTPSFVSAPQNVQPSPSGRTNLLSPVTSFFLNPFDPRDPADDQ